MENSKKIEYKSLKRLNPPITLISPIINADLALQNKFHLQIGGIVDIGIPPNWEISFKENQSTKRLWLHSLHFLLWLSAAWQETSDEKYSNKANDLIVNYLTWLSERGITSKIGWFDDHMVASRSKTLTYIYFKRHELNLSTTTIELIEKSIHEHAAWLADSKNYLENNHGTMMDQALITIALLGVSDKDQSDDWILTAINRLHRTLGNTFDDKGCCKENSAGYHLLNVSLYTDIVRFLKEYELIHMAPDMESIVSKARNVTPLFLRKNGSLPTVGDSELIPKISIDKNDRDIIGTGFFPDAGFFIHKDTRLHLTAKCGGQSFVHRHVDDTSITLHYDGDDILIDGGYYSYDTSLRLARYYRSYLAHSGIFTKESDKLRFNQFKLPSDIADMDYYCRTDNGCMLTMNSFHSTKSKVKRHLTIVNQELIQLHDIITSKEQIPWRQQFMLSPEVKIEKKNATTAILTAKKSTWEVSQQNITDISMTIENGQFSRDFMKTEETKCLVFYGSSSEVQLYTNIFKTGHRS